MKTRTNPLYSSFIWMLLVGTVQANDENLYQNRTAGFQIRKPKGWAFVTAETLVQNRNNVRLNDRDLEELVRRRANIPFVAIARYPEPYSDLNPSVQVLLRPSVQLTGKTPVELLNSIVGVLESSFKDFHVEEPAGASSLDGLQAGHIRVRYTIADAAGREYRTRARIWLVPRGAVTFIISMSGPPDGPNASDKEFEQILRSIKLAK